MDRSSKRRQVKPLATSLLEALDYDSSDDSDFKVGDASDSEGSIGGSDDGSKDSGECSGTDSEDDLKDADMSAVHPEEEEERRASEGEDAATGYTRNEDKVTDDQSGKEEPKKDDCDKLQKKERPSEADITTDDQANEPKKWNLRRNRPMLDFITMEELNAMDDYDSEDDNDWRPTGGRRKGKSSTGEGSDGEDDEEDDASEEESNQQAGNKDDSCSSSDDEGKKKKIKIPSRNSGDDEELTNDSLTLSQSKSNEDSLILEKSDKWCSQKMDHILICCVCLGDNSEDADEIIQCDNCGITVHEGCYGVDGESDSIMSSASENSTEPWFCDACKCGVTPSCELCPNQDGIFKETDAGRWVHIVCALYVPGVAFGDIDKLRPVTLTEMNYSKYGAKECSFCEDPRFARTGVCISCDAGMCRAYFHVTCAQKEGLLSEAAAEEDIADPFFAYCKQHADRFDRKWKRKNYLALQSYCKMSLKEREKHLTPEAQARISARLQQYRVKSELARNTRPQAWVPREKLPRPLTSSASAIRKLMRKAELMGISTDIFPVDNADTTSSVDGRRKHKQPALTSDFVNYYLERNMRMMQLQENLSEQKNIKDKLENEQEKLHIEYNKLCEALDDLHNVSSSLRNEGQGLWVMMCKITSQFLIIMFILPGQCFCGFAGGFWEAPALSAALSVKLRLLQCSECDQAGSSDLEADFAMETLPNGTKRSRRQIKEPVKFVSQDVPQDTKKTPLRSTKPCFRGRRKSSQLNYELSEDVKKEKLPVDTKQAEILPEQAPRSEMLSRTRGQKRKRSYLYEEDKPEERSSRERRRRQPMVLHKKLKSEDLRTECASCKGTGDNENLVRCDECKLCYHFGCLDPPLKKSPKQTGYGWICQECDSSSSKVPTVIGKLQLPACLDSQFLPCHPCECSFHSLTRFSISWDFFFFSQEKRIPECHHRCDCLQYTYHSQQWQPPSPMSPIGFSGGFSLGGKWLQNLVLTGDNSIILEQCFPTSVPPARVHIECSVKEACQPAAVQRQSAATSALFVNIEFFGWNINTINISLYKYGQQPPILLVSEHQERFCKKFVLAVIFLLGLYPAITHLAEHKYPIERIITVTIETVLRGKVAQTVQKVLKIEISGKIKVGAH
ncbi:PHD finger protein 14 [Hyla sarda]|uniref:PHD finger protein 14 n=1 Tax=Hyla sarda TaxID=327740 RepID=UPI0024C3A763|nr:PHD finger protein 14 [Hyla sarda]